MAIASRTNVGTTRTWFGLALAVTLLTLACRAQTVTAGEDTEKPSPLAGPATTPPATTRPAASQAEIDALIVQLDDDQFARRQDASKKLAAIGQASIPALTKSAGSTKPEVSARSMELLRTFLDGEDPACKQAAQEALTTLAGGEGPAAEEAKKLLDARKPKPQPGMGRLIIGNAQLAIGPGGVAARKMSVKNVNGVKDIEVEENNRKIKIHDDPNSGITVEIPETKDGKETVKKYEAKTAAELEKKHPEAYKLYKEYSQGNGAIQLQIGNLAAGGVINVPPGGAVAVTRPNIAQIRLQSMVRQLEMLAKDPQLQTAPPAVRAEMIKQMEKARQQLADLEKQLKDQADKEAKDAKEKGEKPKDETKPQAQGGATQVIVGGDGVGEIKVEVKVEAPPEK